MLALLGSPLALVAQMSDEEALALAFALALLGACALALIVQAIVCWLLHGDFRAIPERHRTMSPPMVWLLMIPLVPLVYNFWVFPGLADSFRRAFDEEARDEPVGDCGRALGLWYAISYAAGVVPIVGYLAAPAALVLLVLFLVKANQLKTQLAASRQDTGWGQAAP